MRLALLVLGIFGSVGFGAEPVGIAERVPWTTSKVVGSPNPPPPYRAAKAFPDLKILCPISVYHEPGTGNLLIINQSSAWNGNGRVLRLKDDDGVKETEELLDIDGIAYGLAFHPDFEKNGYLFVGDNGPIKGDAKKCRITRYTMSRKPPHKIEPDSAKVIIEWASNGHNGADLAFAKDGTLYVTSGDGTSDSDTDLAGQDLTRLLSKVLRIDVDHPEPGKTYSVPADNPFVKTEGIRPETWAYGFRQPWRLFIDKPTGDVWVGQNGQDLWEQVYLVERGANYGWSVVEGGYPFYPNRKTGPQPIRKPLVDHPHSEFRSLTGGVVYRGDKLPDLRGAYVYGDWSTGRIWGVKHDKGKVTWNRELAVTTLQISGFGLDSKGELLVVDHGGGFYRLEPNPTRDQSAIFPQKLSETGIFLSTKDNKPQPGLIPYSVNAPLWSDGASKERFIGLPGDAKMTVTAAHGWTCPDGTVLVKTFSLPTKAGERRIETRLMTRQGGQWAGYSYLWDDQQTDAVLVADAGLDKTFDVKESSGEVRKQTWHFPSRVECMACHSRAANWVLGLSTVQMNKVHDYGGKKADQLTTLAHLGVLSAKLAKPPQELPRLVDPADAKASPEARAKSYLHANCAHCHVQSGGGNAAIDLDFNAKPEKVKLYDVKPLHHTFGLADARLVAPGEPERSVLLERLTRRGEGQMPPLSSSLVDRDAVKLLREWIAGLKRE